MINNKNTKGVHWSFWLIGIIALIWNALGAANYIAQLDPAMVATYPESHRAVIDGRPAWATGAFALAVFGGAIGCILLLLKKSAANYFFIASLLGVIVTMVHTFRIEGSIAGSSSTDIILTVLSPLLVAIFLVWYFRWTRKKGWIS